MQGPYFTIIIKIFIMASTSFTNRNRWTDLEDQTMLGFIQTCETKTKAFEMTSKKLGRSVGACQQRYSIIKQANEAAEGLSREELHTLLNAAIKQREGMLLDELVTAIVLGLTPQQTNNFKFLLANYNLFK